MKILIYTHAFAPSVGGVETYIMLLAKGLAQSAEHSGGELQVTLVTPTPPGNWDDHSLPFRVVRQPSLPELLRLFWGADVIHLAGPTLLPMVLSLLFRKPLVVEHDGYQACCPNGLLLDERTKTVCPGNFMNRHYRECLGCNAANVGWWKSFRMLVLTFPRRWICGYATRNIAPSLHVGRRVALPRTVNIHHGVPEPLRPAQRNHTGSSACFSCVGRLVQEKGVPVLLGAAKILSSRGCNFHLKIIGDGPQRGQLEAMTDLYGLRQRTTFTGFLQGDALHMAQEGSIATVMPCIYEDIAPLAAIEHLIQGRLLIASNIGGLGELVGESGLRFEAGNEEQLASCLQRVLDNPELAVVFGEKARERARQLFAVEGMVQQHIALYRELSVTGTDVRQATLIPG